MTCKKQAEAQPIDGLAIVKETSTLGKLIIKGVPKEEAKRMIVENHYSHKWNEGGFGKYNFGVFRAEEPDKCLGVAVYGYMKNSCFETEAIYNQHDPSYTRRWWRHLFAWITYIPNRKYPYIPPEKRPPMMKN